MLHTLIIMFEISKFLIATYSVGETSRQIAESINDVNIKKYVVYLYSWKEVH